jgi:hypothetical protein
MSIYYGFEINVTNCFSGNEKGHVEKSVDVIRNKVFAPRYEFDSFEDAEEYLNERLVSMNKGIRFEEEKAYLSAYRPPLETAEISQQRVDKYSFVRVDNHLYSVPDCLVGRNVTIKNYPLTISIFSEGHKVCEHRKEEGYLKATVEITHYLDTFMRKPGALKNSVALKSKDELKALFDEYFTGREKEFIGILKENAEKDLSGLVAAVRQSAHVHTDRAPETIEDNVTMQTLSQITALSLLFGIGKETGQYAN